MIENLKIIPKHSYDVLWDETTSNFHTSWAQFGKLSATTEGKFSEIRVQCCFKTTVARRQSQFEAKKITKLLIKRVFIYCCWSLAAATHSP